MIALLLGCTYTVHLASRPSPALVQLPDGRRITTPDDVKIRWRPFSKATATVTASGYRPLEIELRDLRLRSGRAFSGQVGELTILLVPTHGPTGTWAAEDVPE
ncbi:MAG: hypothetical protein KC656_18140 [Myxococcales bacterium]|nr:hypothetical protein [Myxococcales bacterium]